MRGQKTWAIAIAMSFFVMSMLGVTWDTGVRGEMESRADYTAFDAVNYTLETGWYMGYEIQYYDFGETSNETSAIYLFYNETTGDRFIDQKPVFDNVDGDIFNEIPDGSLVYDTHYRRVVEVTVSDSYAAGDINSSAQIEVGLNNITAMALNTTLVNCPQVPPGSFLKAFPHPTPVDIPAQEGVYEGNNVSYFMFEANATLNGLYEADREIPTIVAELGLDTNGSLANNTNAYTFTVDGQYPIVDAHNMSGNFSMLKRDWVVGEGAGYIPNDARTHLNLSERADIDTVTHTDTFYNMVDVGDAVGMVQYTHAAPVDYPAIQVWLNNNRSYVWDFGATPLSPTSVFYFYDTAGDPIAGQYPVIENISGGVYEGVAGDASYSHITRVYKVEVPLDYAANTVQNFSDIAAEGYLLNETDTFVNAPLVPMGSTLVNDVRNPEMAWYNGNPVYFFDFESNDATLATGGSFYAGDWITVNATTGQVDYTTTDVYDFITEGQASVVTMIKDDPGYSSLRVMQDVTPETTYVADSVRAYDDFDGAWTITPEVGTFYDMPSSGDDTPVTHYTHAAAETIDPMTGWWQGDEVTYYDFGAASPTSMSNIYVLVSEGTTPIFGHAPVFDEVSNDIYPEYIFEDNYNSFKQVVYVTVGAGYEVNDIKSFTDLQNTGWEMNTSYGHYVNAPMVPKGTTLNGDPDARTINQGWYKGTDAYFYCFETNSAALATFWDGTGLTDLWGTTELKTAPLYQVYDGSSPVANQDPIFKYDVAEAEYSPLVEGWKVSAPAEYSANDARTAENITDDYDVEGTASLGTMNHPIVGTPTAVAPPFTPAGPEAPGTGEAWCDGGKVMFWTFGTFTSKAPAPVYLFVDPTGAPVTGQTPIFNDVRGGLFTGVNGSAGYTDFRQVHIVTVSDGYVADSVMSYADFDVSWTVAATDTVVNTPMVPAGSTLEGDPDGRAIQMGYYMDNPVYFYTFEYNNATLQTDFGLGETLMAGLYDTVASEVATSKYYHFTNAPGQADIFGSKIGEVDYSPLWQVVNVEAPAGFIPGSARSEEDLTEAFTQSPTTNYMNAPMTSDSSTVDVLPVYGHAAPPANGTSSMTAYYNGSEITYYNFGPGSRMPSEMYVFEYADGTGVDDQVNVMETISDLIMLNVSASAGHSDMRRVTRVVVPDDYVPNTLKSVADITASGYTLNQTNIVINAPMAPKGTTLPDDPDSRTQVRGWWNGTDVYYFEFESSEDYPGMYDHVTNEVAIAEMYVFIDEEIEDTQPPLLTVFPTDLDYTPLNEVWEVELKDPDEWVVGSALSLEALEDFDEQDPDFSRRVGYLNCPVVGDQVEIEPIGEPTIPIRIGPMLDANKDPIFGATLTLTPPALGTRADGNDTDNVTDGADGEDYSGPTDNTGIATITVPLTWAGQKIHVIMTKDGLQDLEFDIIFDALGNVFMSGFPIAADVPDDTGFVDTDGDGLSDEYELAHDLDPNDPDDAASLTAGAAGGGDGDDADNTLYVILIVMLLLVVVILIILMARRKPAAAAPEEEMPEEEALEEEAPPEEGAGEGEAEEGAEDEEELLCPECGAVLPPDGNTCPGCGVEFEIEEEEVGEGDEVPDKAAEGEMEDEAPPEEEAATEEEPADEEFEDDVNLDDELDDDLDLDIDDD